MTYHFEWLSFLVTHYSGSKSKNSAFRLIWCAELFAGYLFHDICFNIGLGESIIWVDAADVVDMECVQKGHFKTEGWLVCFLFSLPHWSPKSSALWIHWPHIFCSCTINPALLVGVFFPWLPCVSEPGIVFLPKLSFIIYPYLSLKKNYLSSCKNLFPYRPTFSNVAQMLP